MITAAGTALMLAACLQDPQMGSIRGRVTPEAPVRVVAKPAGKDPSVKENVKGEVLLAKGGEFHLEKLPPGKYDLVFQVQGDDAKKFITHVWSEIFVEAGKTVEGIYYRMTPADAAQDVDAILVQFSASVSDGEALKLIEAQGCKVKGKSPRPPVRYVVHISEDKEVPEMLKVFKAIKGVEVAEPNSIRRIR